MAGLHLFILYTINVLTTYKDHEDLRFKQRLGWQGSDIAIEHHEVRVEAGKDLAAAVF